MKARTVPFQLLERDPRRHGLSWMAKPVPGDTDELPPDCRSAPDADRKATRRRQKKARKANR